MNIYDEAIKVLKDSDVNDLQYMTKHEAYMIIHKALERAKIEYKLVGLLNEKCDYLVHIMNGAKGLQENYMKLLSKIDGLEKELNEMN